MHAITKPLVAVLTGLALSFGAGSASADSVTYTLNAANSGSGLGSGPFGTVEVDWVNLTTADVIFTANTAGGYAFLDGTSAGLNVSGAFSATTPTTEGATPTGYTCSSLSTCGAQHLPTPMQETIASPGANISQWGHFDFTLDQHDGWGSATSQLLFVLTATGTNTWTSAAAVLTANDAGQLVVAHVGNDGGNNTGFAAAVPIPAAAWLFGSGLIGLIGIARRKLSAAGPGLQGATT